MILIFFVKKLLNYEEKHNKKMIFWLQVTEPRQLIGLRTSGDQTSSLENNIYSVSPPLLGSGTRCEVKCQNVFLLLSHRTVCCVRLCSP